MSSRSRFLPNSLITEAAFIETPAFAKNQRPRGVRRAGITFEKRVGEVLERNFGWMVVAGAWISYHDNTHGVRICQPDYLVVDVRAGEITIVECKLSHTQHAWQQLYDVYKPVIEFMFPGFKVRGIEVCKNFERSVQYPVEPKIVSDFNKDFTGFDNVMVMYGF